MLQIFTILDISEITHGTKWNFLCGSYRKTLT